VKKYPAILHNGDTLQWLGEVPPESLTGETYDVIIEVDTDQFERPDKTDHDNRNTAAAFLENQTASE
jgi:hypothetical protein